jgi:hypothetical protein|nr:hypothetical protein [uncultured Flavobacterium sp.]
MSQNFKPESFFFVDSSNLRSPVYNTDGTLDQYYGTDALGPVKITGSDNSVTYPYFRTTAKIRANDNTPKKVFAIAQGRILFQPQIGN